MLFVHLYLFLWTAYSCPWLNFLSVIFLLLIYKSSLYIKILAFICHIFPVSPVFFKISFFFFLLYLTSFSYFHAVRFVFFFFFSLESWFYVTFRKSFSISHFFLNLVLLWFSFSQLNPFSTWKSMCSLKNT